MLNLIALNRELNSYRVLRDSVSSTSSILNKSFDALEVASNKIGEYYTIDDVRADSSQITDCRKKIEGRKNYLTNTVIPAIDREIARIKKEIERAEAEMQRL